MIKLFTISDSLMLTVKSSCDRIGAGLNALRQAIAKGVAA